MRASSGRRRNLTMLHLSLLSDDIWTSWALSMSNGGWYGWHEFSDPLNYLPFMLPTLLWNKVRALSCRRAISQQTDHPGMFGFDVMLSHTWASQRRISSRL